MNREVPDGHDRYPSRKGRPPKLLDRQDPVVWGDTVLADRPGPLRAEQIEQFDTDGFVIVADLFDRTEVAALTAAVDLLIADPDVPGERVIREPGSEAVRSVFGFHDHAGPDPTGALAGVVHDDRLAGAARQILADEVSVHQSRVNRKPGFRGKEFQWHSDIETWHTEDGMPAMRCLSAVVSLTDNHPWNGSLLVMPGSHRSFVTCPTPTPPANHERSLVAQEVGVPDEDSLRTLYDRCGIEQCTGPAGSVLFFDCNLMHGSASNISPEPRSNLFMVFNSIDNACVEPFSAPQRRPEHLASRTAIPV